jgi:hypothetical protein
MNILYNIFYMDYKKKYLELKKQFGGNRKSFLEKLKKERKKAFNTFLHAKVLKALYDAIYNDSIKMEDKIQIFKIIFPKSILVDDNDGLDELFGIDDMDKFRATKGENYERGWGEMWGGIYDPIRGEFNNDEWFLDLDHYDYDSRLQKYLEDNEGDELVNKLEDISSNLPISYPCPTDNEYDNNDDRIEEDNNELEKVVEEIDKIPGYGIEFLELVKNTTYEQKK